MSDGDLFEKYEFSKAKTLLVVQPHPDDAEIGAGGTIARFSDAGASVYYVTVTDGSMGTTDKSISPEQLTRRRMKEEEDAMKILGVRANRWLGCRDSEVTPSQNLRSQIMRVVREIRPDVVITVDPWLPYEAHPDHRHVGMMASEAALLSKFPHINSEHAEEGLEAFSVSAVAYMITARPNTFVDVTDTFERKLEAIRAHVSQFEEEWPTYRALLTSNAERNAKKVGQTGKLFEAFKVLRLAQLHVNDNAENE
jgi:LmbE family N-acetylglucosaminyl deacetylase